MAGVQKEIVEWTDLGDAVGGASPKPMATINFYGGVGEATIAW